MILVSREDIAPTPKVDLELETKDATSASFDGPSRLQCDKGSQVRCCWSGIIHGADENRRMKWRKEGKEVV